MTEEFSGVVVRQFAAEIAALTIEMSGIAQSAVTFCEKGLEDRAMDALHDVEPLLHDTKTLLLATSLVRRLGSKKR